MNEETTIDLPCIDCVSLAICIPIYAGYKRNGDLPMLRAYILGNRCNIMNTWIDEVDKIEDSDFMINIMKFIKYFDSKVPI